MQAKRWNELSQQERVMVVIAGIIQFALLAAALVDLRRRPAAEIRGRKPWWTAASFVNFVGPLAYFAFGRRHRTRDSDPPVTLTRETQ